MWLSHVTLTLGSCDHVTGLALLPRWPPHLHLSSSSTDVLLICCPQYWSVIRQNVNVDQVLVWTGTDPGQTNWLIIGSEVIDLWLIWSASKYFFISRKKSLINNQYQWSIQLISQRLISQTRPDETRPGQTGTNHRDELDRWVLQLLLINQHIDLLKDPNLPGKTFKDQTGHEHMDILEQFLELFKDSWIAWNLSRSITALQGPQTSLMLALSPGKP